MQVEKDVPVPVKYPFHEMEVGDSFELAPTMKRATVTVAAQRWDRRTVVLGSPSGRQDRTLSDAGGQND